MEPNSISGVVITALNDLIGQVWLVIPIGLAIFGVIYGLGRAKKAAKVAAS